MREYDGSLPTSVMSVPCSVVTTFGALTVRAQDLSRQKRGRRVRHRVVRVDDVQTRLARHLHDPVRERQQILRLAEQRIRRRQHLVEEQPFLKLSEPERRFRADEVRLMPAQRKRLAQLGGDDAASADRGVADDADVQRTSHDRKEVRP